jgi:hypothetical protein
MKECTYCGLENSDETVRCQGCGTDFAGSETLSTNLQTGDKDSPKQRNSHVFGTASVSSPFVGFVLGWCVVILAPHDPDSGHMGFRNLYWGLDVFVFALVVGFILALIAWRRGEKHWKLILAGLALNLGPLLFMSIPHAR